MAIFRPHLRSSCISTPQVSTDQQPTVGRLLFWVVASGKSTVFTYNLLVCRRSRANRTDSDSKRSLTALIANCAGIAVNQPPQARENLQPFRNCMSPNMLLHSKTVHFFASYPKIRQCDHCIALNSTLDTLCLLPCFQGRKLHAPAVLP